MEHDISAQISGIIIMKSISEDQFSLLDIKSEINNNVEDERVRKIAKQLEQDGWIKRNKTTTLEYWTSGPLTLKYGDIVKFSKRSEGTIPVLPDENVD